MSMNQNEVLFKLRRLFKASLSNRVAASGVIEYSTDLPMVDHDALEGAVDELL